MFYGGEALIEDPYNSVTNDGISRGRIVIRGREKVTKVVKGYYG